MPFKKKEFVKGEPSSVVKEECHEIVDSSNIGDLLVCFKYSFKSGDISIRFGGTVPSPTGMRGIFQRIGDVLASALEDQRGTQNERETEGGGELPN